MKKNFSLWIAVILILTACHKDDGKSIVDCFGESLFVNVHHSIAAENPKQVNYTITYSGSYSLNTTVVWKFGDGTEQTLTGTQATHIYSQPGNYTATAVVKLNGPSCTFNVNEHVTIQ